MEKQPDLIKRETGSLRSLDHGQRAHDLTGVAATTGHSRRIWKQADLLVVANRRGRLPALASDLADAHHLGKLRNLVQGLDIKLT
jgi:hypothetical protein